MIVDTNILIDALRGRSDAIQFFESSDTGFSVSVPIIAELFAGINTARERAKIIFVKKGGTYSV